MTRVGRPNKRPVLPKGLPWSDEQAMVIAANPNERILVDAGPGAGKTAVACARIAWLIDQAGLVPSDIWLVSFTRTAVHELRSRVGTYLSDPEQAAGIRIATIDSHAWAIQSGFNREALLTGSYDENIRNVIRLIQTNEGVFQYVGNVRHLFIDEAQDVVGPRVELLLELINALSPESGVTVFCDEAQAIYGFSEDHAAGDLGGTLPEKIREFMGDAFRELELTRIHRTDDETLVELFTDGRAFLKDGELDGAEKYAQVRRLIEGTNHGDLGSHHQDLKNLPEDLDDSFLLFRKRGDALSASRYLGDRPHRIRMSGLPHTIHDWIGVMFWDWTEPALPRTEFESRWKSRLSDRRDLSMGKSWELLVRLVGVSETRIDMHNLARRLGSGSPPIDLCRQDFGFAGPLIGTIHGAKGREADHVRLYLPPVRDDDQDSDAMAEEARVIFVGASRAREGLQVGRSSSKVHARSLEGSGRAFTAYYYMKGAVAAVEIGRVGDIDPEGLVGRALHSTPEEAEERQSRIASLEGSIHTAVGETEHLGTGWRYGVQSECWPDEALCYLNNRVDNDLFGIARAIDAVMHRHYLRPPTRLIDLRTFGTRTLVMRPDDPDKDSLHSPWRDSGFMLAPLVLGYGMSYFRR